MYLCIIHWYYVLFTGTIKNAFSALGTIHDCVLYFPKKKIAADAAKICDPHGSYGGSLSSVSEPNIRLTLKPNRRQKSASVCPNRAPALKTLHSVCTVVKSLFDKKKFFQHNTPLDPMVVWKEASAPPPAVIGQLVCPALVANNWNNLQVNIYVRL